MEVCIVFIAFCVMQKQNPYFSLVKNWRGPAAQRFWNVNFLLGKGRPDNMI
jgi:hypothetical protein